MTIISSTKLPPNHYPLKQGVDKIVPLRIRSQLAGTYPVFGFQPTDIARMELRETPDRTAPRIGELKSPRNFQIIPAPNEQILVIFYGEETIAWELSAVKNATKEFYPVYDNGRLLLPRQSLYGTLYITDSELQDRPMSGEEFSFSMEISLTAPEPLPPLEELP